MFSSVGKVKRFSSILLKNKLEFLVRILHPGGFTISVNTVEFQAQIWEINMQLFDVGLPLVCS